MCFAFKSGSCEETYLEHVRGIMECIDGLWEYKSLLRKISMLLNIEEENIRALTRLLVVLHDIGKLAEDNQKECFNVGCTRFEYHYIISARVASGLLVDLYEDIDETIRAILYDEESNNINTLSYYVLVVFPIMFHHYAQITEESLEKALNKTRELGELKIYDKCIDMLREIIAEYFPRSESNDQLLSNVIKELEKQLNKGILKLGVLALSKLNLLFSYRYSKWKYTIEAIIGILNMCDGKVAYINREQKCKENSLQNQ